MKGHRLIDWLIDCVAVYIGFVDESSQCEPRVRCQWHGQFNITRQQRGTVFLSCWIHCQFTSIQFSLADTHTALTVQNNFMILSFFHALKVMLHIHTERNLLHIPRGNRLSTYGRRAFATAGPSAWNSLSHPVRHPNAAKLLQAPAKDILFAPSALGVYTGDALYDLHIDNDTLT